MEYYTTQARRRRSQPPAWLWFFAGLLIGALAVGLIWMKQEGAPKVAEQQATETNPATKTVAKKEEKPSEVEKKDTPKTDFTFYDTLPKMEVTVPEKETNKPSASITPPSPQKPEAVVKAEEPTYLQMGSFSSFKDADRLKARLGLLNIETDIQSATIGSGSGKKIVHRVLGGPYSRNQAHYIQETLKNNKIESFVVKK